MKQLSILIVGAGPTGLMMACELARHDISFRIIDKKSERTEGSNATWIQTRTIEIFDALGIVNSFLKIGHKCHAINFYDNGKPIANMPLDVVDSVYPFVLMLPQRETERLLNNKLEESKVYVEHSLELIDIKQTNKGVVSTIRLSDSSTETITSDWVIACDGANSTIRERCRIPFHGDDIPEQFMVADAEMDSFLPIDEIHVFFDKGTILPEKGTIFAAFPWGSKEYRLSANLYAEVPRQTFHEHEVKEIVAERTNGNFIVESVSWISPFWIRDKIVNQMQNNSIYLMGDAAHIHSPAGGQGMNTGLQDAYNLAWKLALVIKNKAKSSLLESYQLERYPVVNNIVEQTGQLTKSMLFDKSFFTKLQEFSKSLSQNKIAKKTASELTQLAICYENSPVINYDEVPPIEAPKQGERAPVNQCLRNPYHNILLFTGLTPEKNILQTLVTVTDKLKSISPDLIKVHVISTIDLKIDNLVFDKNHEIHKQFVVENLAIYVVRPDTYISYFSKKWDTESLEQFLKRYLL